MPYSSSRLPGEDKAEPGGDVLLQPLEVVVGELDDATAAVADHVIVMVMLTDVGVFVSASVRRRRCCSSASPHSLSSLIVRLDRRVAHARIDLAHLAVELVDAHVAGGRPKNT